MVEREGFRSAIARVPYIPSIHRADGATKLDTMSALDNARAPALTSNRVLGSSGPQPAGGSAFQ